MHIWIRELYLYWLDNGLLPVQNWTNGWHLKLEPEKQTSLECKSNLLLFGNGICKASAIFFRAQWSAKPPNYRADSMFEPSQWGTPLQSNAVSHWLGTNLESALHYICWILSYHTDFDGLMHGAQLTSVSELCFMWYRAILFIFM